MLDRGSARSMAKMSKHRRGTFTVSTFAYYGSTYSEHLGRRLEDQRCHRWEEGNEGRSRDLGLVAKVMHEMQIDSLVLVVVQVVHILPSVTTLVFNIFPVRYLG